MYTPNLVSLPYLDTVLPSCLFPFCTICVLPTSDLLKLKHDNLSEKMFFIYIWGKNKVCYLVASFLLDKPNDSRVAVLFDMRFIH